MSEQETVTPSPPPPRFCVDCQHIGTNGSGEAKLFRCFAPQNVAPTPDLVTGGKIYHFDTCYQARLGLSYEACGKQGNWWVKKDERTRPKGFPESPAPLKRSVESILSDLEKWS